MLVRTALASPHAKGFVAARLLAWRLGSHGAAQMTTSTMVRNSQPLTSAAKPLLFTLSYAKGLCVPPATDRQAATTDRLKNICEAASSTMAACHKEPRLPSLIQIKNLEKYVEAGGQKFFLLRRINLEIPQGDFVTIMGPSGAGKSTLLGILGMLDGAWSGEYSFLEQPVHRLSVKQRNELHKYNIGFVFQSYHLIDTLTVYENLEIPLSYKNIPSKERAGIVCDALDRFNIVGKKDLFPNQLSGGQQQLVGVARAVIQNPKLILADEPTGNLHSAQGEEIMELFKKLNDAGTTIVQVTHSDKNAAYGNRIIQLRDGWVVGENSSAAAQTS
jgi:putative ABC transport system ATP-binding protein